MESNLQSGKETPAKKSRNKAAYWLAAPFLALGIGVGVAQYRAHQALKEAEVAAQEMFAPALEALEPKPTEPVDLDKTVRVIHGMDRALESQGDLRAYLQYMARQDFRGVAPDVMEARKKVMDVLMRVYARQTELENQEATFTVTRTVLSAMSLVQADVSVTSPGASLDREQAKSILEDLRAQQEARKQLLDALNGLELELIGVMGEYSQTYYKYLAQWDELSLIRDRAYLAAAEGNWEAALGAARTAAERAPQDVEAHLLMAWALIESSKQGESAHLLEEAVTVLNEFVQRHPERTAPALVLLGAAHARMGRLDQASLFYQQAAAYYPRQAGLLTDMMDPYQARAFLRKSKEGKAIVDMYHATMVGAGAFSPDLRMAQSHFAEGRIDEGRKKILDHFSRRRNQEQWSLILEDLKYCERELTPYFDQILVEDSHLFLDAKPTLLGSALDVGVQNQSDRALRNGTLLLAVRFTDMHRDDFEVLKVGETVPVVSPQARTDFGTLEVAFPLFGVVKEADDIVMTRSILITDDAVVWVDSDAFRLAQARTEKKTAQVPQAETPARTWFDALKLSPDTLSEMVKKHAKVDVELGLGKDDLTLTLPREIAWMDPIFRAGEGDGAGPSENALTQEGIRLEFADLANFDEPTKPVRMRAHSRYGTLEFLVDVPGRKVVDVIWNP
jgi:tetratricopeptide (TPR) repeat protein